MFQIVVLSLTFGNVWIGDDFCNWFSVSSTLGVLIKRSDISLVQMIAVWRQHRLSWHVEVQGVPNFTQIIWCAYTLFRDSRIFSRLR